MTDIVLHKHEKTTIIKENMKCPICNKEVNPEWNNCPICGYKARLCSRKECNARWLPIHAHFCPQCGSPIAGEENLNLKEKIADFISLETDKNDNTVAKNWGGNVLTFIINNVEFKMIQVTVGIFEMGDSEYVDNPVHEVELTQDYYIGETAVTQALWEAVMHNNPSEFIGKDLPVDSVAYYDEDNKEISATIFIARLNSLLRQSKELTKGYRFDLPTEAQWEYAARGGNKSDGYLYSGSNEISEVAWFEENSGETHPVYSTIPNELGIYGMSGNVAEWCKDWYDHDYYNSSRTDPTGPTKGSKRVVRGGNCTNSAYYCRIAFRNFDNPTSSTNGFRLALVHQG